MHGSSKRPRRATAGKRDATCNVAAGCVRARFAALALLTLAHIPGTRHCSDLPALVQQQRARDSDHSDGHVEELKLIRGTFFPKLRSRACASKKKPQSFRSTPPLELRAMGPALSAPPCRFCPCCLQIVLPWPYIGVNRSLSTVNSSFNINCTRFQNPNRLERNQSEPPASAVLRFKT